MKYILRFNENEINPNTFEMLQIAFGDFYDEFDSNKIGINIFNETEYGAEPGSSSVTFFEAYSSIDRRVGYEEYPRGFHSKLEYTIELYEYILDMVDKLKDEDIILERVLYCPPENGPNDWIKHDNRKELLIPGEIYTVGLPKSGWSKGKPIVKVDNFKYIMLVFKSKDI